MDIVHRDVRADNILLSCDGKAKLADFGLAALCPLNKFVRGECGNNDFKAPEMFDLDGVPSKYDRRVDVFAIGRFSIEMAMEGGSYSETVLRDEYSKSFKNFVVETAKDYRIRPYASQLLDLPFLTQDKWSEKMHRAQLVVLARKYKIYYYFENYFVVAEKREEEEEQQRALGVGASTVTVLGDAPAGGEPTATTAGVCSVPMDGGSSIISAVGGRAEQPATPADATRAPADKKKNEPVTEAPKRALDKSLNTIDGQNPDQFVALWYQHGEPVIGRVWRNESGKIAANRNDREYTGKVGLIQLLVHTWEHVRGFDYHWKPFSDVFRFRTEREFVPVHVDHFKGDIAPAVITFNGKQILGKASAGFRGKENIVDGPPVHPVTIVLTRRARDGCKFD